MIAADDTLEGFLRAIAASPNDPLPRQIFADYIEEHGDPIYADLMRQSPLKDQSTPGATAEAIGPAWWELLTEDGTREIPFDARQLTDPALLRIMILSEHPAWYLRTRLRITNGVIAGAAPMDTLLSASWSQQVTIFHFQGTMIGSPPTVMTSPETFPLYDFEYRPVLTLLAVEGLVQNRAARRITHLNLTHNLLDNDAARLLVRSTVLHRLVQLDFLDGNNIRGDTWSELLDRFGEDVVT
ncbi:MAG: TIGR02996 domain-containing protein [Gemmataceae bacterium]